jgi:hypothetical protein
MDHTEYYLINAERLRLANGKWAFTILWDGRLKQEYGSLAPRLRAIAKGLAVDDAEPCFIVARDGQTGEWRAFGEDAAISEEVLRLSSSSLFPRRRIRAALFQELTH